MVSRSGVTQHLDDAHHNEKCDSEHLNGRKKQGSIGQWARGCASAREQSIPESKWSRSACDARTEQLQRVASTEDWRKRHSSDGQQRKTQGDLTRHGQTSRVQNCADYAGGN